MEKCKPATILVTKTAGNVGVYLCSGVMNDWLAMMPFKL